jgi:hypothetical protein
VTMTDPERNVLRNALREYARANTEAKMAHAVLSLGSGLDEAMRACLVSRGMGEVDSQTINYPEFVYVVRDHTDLFEGDVGLPDLLVSLNSTCRRIAHPELGRPWPSEIARDAAQHVNLARRFWPRLFGEAFPESLLGPSAKPGPSPESARPLAPEPSLGQPPTNPPLWPKARRLLSRLWSDERTPRFQKGLFLKRVFGIAASLTLAKLCKDAAIFTARWPEPVKSAGVVLFILAMGLFAWGLVLLWKLLRQIRLKGLLIALGVAYGVLLSVTVLTSENPLPRYGEAWEMTREHVTSTSQTIMDTGNSVVGALEEFRGAYVGHRLPRRLPGMDSEDPLFLTPIPANRPARTGSRHD